MRCTRCLYDDSIPNIKFDENGVCDYCHIHDRMEMEYPTGREGLQVLKKIAKEAKEQTGNIYYDVVVGFSGGCDSTYTLWLAKKLGLRPLAVHFDNGWNTQIAMDNMEKVSKALNINLITYKVDPEEFDDILKAFFRSGVGDLDIANDIGLTAVLYMAAEQHNIKHIFIGHSFRTEGIAPIGWTYMDGKYIEDVHKKHGELKMKTYPNLKMRDFIRWNKIKRVRPLYYVDYQKEKVKKMLTKELGFEWYGGHHMENVFTAYEVAHFLPKRYGIDMRLLGHSALVRSGQLDRQVALEELKEPMNGEELAEVVRKRLGFTKKQFKEFYKQPKKTSDDYRTYKKLFKLMKPYWWLMYKLGRVPKSFYIKYAN